MSGRKISYLEAVREAMVQEMKKDETIIFMGQDLSGGAGREEEGLTDTWGGSFGVSRGMSTELGTDRVIDCPLSEAGYMGAAATAATVGLKPIADLMFNDFIWLAGDQLFNGAAKFRYLSAGRITCNLTVRTVSGGGQNAGMHHSQSLYALALNVPGFKVAVPSTPYAAKGVIAAAVHDDNPVIIFENKSLYGTTGEVPEESYECEIGKGEIVREGKDVTVVAISRMRYIAENAAKKLEEEGISVELIDPIWLSPLDENLILESVKKTGHLVVVDEANNRCGVSADLAALVSDKAIDYLDGPIKSVNGVYAPVPFSPPLEEAYLPNEGKIIKAVKEALK